MGREGKDRFMKENEEKEGYGEASYNDKLDRSSTRENPGLARAGTGEQDPGACEPSYSGPQNQKGFTPTPKAALAHR